MFINYRCLPGDVSAVVLAHPSDDQLLGPVVVAGGEAVAAAGQLSADVGELQMETL